MSASLERIAALLAKAERTEHPAEADAYLMKAQSLATLASIDLATARGVRARRERPQTPESRTVTIGEKGKRANTHLISLFVVVAHANSAHVDVASNSTFVISYGMPSDLDVVETMYASLAVQMTASSQRYVTAGEWRGETFTARVRTAYGWGRAKKEFTAQTARASFYRAYISRIDERLAAAREEGIRESDARLAHEDAQESTSSARAEGSGALVLARKDKAVKAFHRQESQARGSWGGYSGAAARASGTAAVEGRRAASSARLGASPELPGPRRQVNR
jgi:hypothetical protein